ncbi:hypothetical protein [Vibrio algicola]|uniref:3-phosphoshikimate 1-carboxyvinyltransferase n=1 Tax=Vibrio algicola TaxID=2662262 RepID=A0A5Q0TKR2_9VIBR|nr:hypothetical protein [Vibrio algicola]
MNSNKKYTEEQWTIIDRVFKAIPDEVCQSFDSQQREAIERSIAINNAVSNHIIDFRPVIKLGRWRYYVVFLFGKDRRKNSRRSTSLSLFIKTLLILSFFLFLFAAAVLIMYLIKSALGIDIFSHFSFGVWDYFKAHFLS